MKRSRLTPLTTRSISLLLFLTTALGLVVVGNIAVIHGFIVTRATTRTTTQAGNALASNWNSQRGRLSYQQQAPFLTSTAQNRSPGNTILWQQRQQSHHVNAQHGSLHAENVDHQQHGSSSSSSSLRVGIAGAGAIALATAALLQQAGHDPMLWSPSGKPLMSMQPEHDNEHDRIDDYSSSKNTVHVTGKLELEFTPHLAHSAQTLVEENDVIVLALPANGHKNVMDAMVPHLRDGHHVIISSHSSLGALYLQSQLQNNNDNCNSIVSITAWGTTVCTARRPAPGQVRINTVRTAIDLCTLTTATSSSSSQAAAAAASDAALATCRRLFPQIKNFVARDGLLAISLSNLNPQNHLGIALGNMSRMEKGEDWYQSLHITPAIGRLLESLDAERLAIADALGLQVKTIFEHFSLSFHVPITDSIADMNQQIHQLGNDVYGPNTADSRYILEDVPFGLVPTIVLGRLVDRPATLHEAGVALVSSMYGRDFYAENDLLQALQLENMSLDDLKARVQPPADVAVVVEDGKAEEGEGNTPERASKKTSRMTESVTR